MRQLAPRETSYDRRDAVLLRIREADGEWIEVGEHCGDRTSSCARSAVVLWKRYCRKTKWQAFEWRTSGTTVFARFVGTRFVQCQKTKKHTWMGRFMSKRPG